jgi:hypothetical protein
VLLVLHGEGRRIRLNYFLSHIMEKAGSEMALPFLFYNSKLLLSLLTGGVAWKSEY